MNGRTHHEGIVAFERLRAAIDQLRVHLGLALMPPHVAKAIRTATETELGIIHLRMIVGDNQEALMESMAAAFNAARRDGISIPDALEAERRHVAQFGPRYPT